MTEKYIPSFWISEEYSGCTLEEFVRYAIKVKDTKRFDPKLHRNQGYKGSGKCHVLNCPICLIMKELGV